MSNCLNKDSILQFCFGVVIQNLMSRGNQVGSKYGIAVMLVLPEKGTLPLLFFQNIEIGLPLKPKVFHNLDSH